VSESSAGRCGEPRREALGGVADDLDLAVNGNMSAAKRAFEQIGKRDLAFFGVLDRLVENLRKAVERAQCGRNGRVIDGERHWSHRLADCEAAQEANVRRIKSRRATPICAWGGG